MRPMLRMLRWTKLMMLATCLASGSALAQGSSPEGVWSSLAADSLAARSAPGASEWIRAERFQAVTLAPSALEAVLSAAPMELSPAARTSLVVLSLPRPDGGFERFAVVESPIVPPELSQWMEEQGWPMKTYAGRSLDDPASRVRLDWGGPAGFHAMVLSPGGRYFIDPAWKGDRSHYTSYFKRDYRAEGKVLDCGVQHEAPPLAGRGPVALAGASTGGNLRTYRVAVAATGEYTAFHGGTVTDGLAAVMTMMNRVSGVYETEVAARLELVPNNNLIIYTDAITDPYTNSNEALLLDENRANLNLVIGSANYDLGHVVGGPGGGGGLAALGVVCGGFKAEGATVSSNPVGDPFDIDFVAHEMGHQFGAEHTWNGSASACSALAFAPTTAYEVGSGSTIMAYAGICGVDNLQPNSDANFHGASLDQILDCIAGGGNCAGTCSVNTAANPNAPTVTAPAATTIPIGTPFELTALNGTDLDGGTLSYSWEQFNLGTRSPLTTGDDGVQPIFRAFPPTTSPTRVFPRLQDLIANTTVAGETLPVTNRSMTFRVTIRDNDPAGGRVGEATTSVTSTTTSGPFLVTAPNGGELFNPGVGTVTWDVANTTSPPVNAANVDILLSTDGGLTYPTSLALGTPNDGSEDVTFPVVATNQARIKVQGSGNIFFDIGNADFTISSALCPNGNLDPGEQCDDGNLLGGDGCTGDCLTEVCVNFASTDVPQPLLDGIQAASTLDVPLAGPISDVNVIDLNGTHTFVSDLDFDLISPAATNVDIIEIDVCFPPGGFSNFDLDLDDAATVPIPCPPTDGLAHPPNNPLADLNGETASGTWTLAILDAFAGDTGSLAGWGLRICVAGDADADAVPDAGDNCPDVPNGPAEAAIPGVGNQTNSDADAQGDACDPCDVYTLMNPLDSNGDQIPDECQCGDADENGFILFADAQILANCVLMPSSCTVDVSIGDTNNDGFLLFADAQRAAQVVLQGLQTPDLTCARRPEGTAP